MNTYVELTIFGFYCILCFQCKFSLHIQRVGFVVLFYFVVYFESMCVYVCCGIWRWGTHMPQHMWRSEDNLWCQTSHSALSETGPLFHHCVTSLASHQLPGSLLSPLPSHCWSSDITHTRAAVSIFAWVLNRSTALYPLNTITAQVSICWSDIVLVDTLINK